MAANQQGTDKSSVLSDKDKFGTEETAKEKVGHMGEKTKEGQSKSSQQSEKK